MQAETGQEKVDAERDRDRALSELSAALAQTNDPALVRDFLASILTAYEVREVATRWALVRLIDGGMSQRNISRTLGLSLCKITRGSKELKKRNSAFRRMVDAYKELVSRSLDVSA